MACTIGEYMVYDPIVGSDYIRHIYIYILYTEYTLYIHRGRYIYTYQGIHYHSLNSAASDFVFLIYGP